MVRSIHPGGRKGRLILSNKRAIVLQQGGQCRRAGGGGGGGGERMVDSCTTASTLTNLLYSLTRAPVFFSFLGEQGRAWLPAAPLGSLGIYKICVEFPPTMSRP